MKCRIKSCELESWKDTGICWKCLMNWIKGCGETFHSPLRVDTAKTTPPKLKIRETPPVGEGSGL